MHSDLSKEIENNSFIKNIKNTHFILLGGSGFVGQRISQILIAAGASVAVIGRRLKLDIHHENLTYTQCDLLMNDSWLRFVSEDSIIIDMSADVGGIYHNNKSPASIFMNNMQLTISNIEKLKTKKIRKYLFVSSVCVYPSTSRLPLKELDTLNTEPETTNAGYGYAKRMGEFLALNSVKEFNLPCAVIRPVNCYGPGDTLDLGRAHVIPSLIMKAIQCGQYFEVYGDPTTTRDFLFVDDFARGCIEAALQLPSGEIINLGTGIETTISSIVQKIENEVYKISGKKIIGHFSKQGLIGQRRRCVSMKKAEKWLNFKPQISIDHGLQKTIHWYYENRSMFIS